MTFATINQVKTGQDRQEWESSEIANVKTNSKTREKSKANELKRMTIALPQETAKMLELLSELQGVTQSEALRRAISTEAFIQREIKSGSRILVQAPDGQVKELVFR